jgi:hypothetical protein
MNPVDLAAFLNPLTYVGAGGAPIIERTTQIIREQFKLSSWVAPYVVLFLTTVEQFVVSWLLHYTPEQFTIGVAITLLTVWHVHEVSK